VSLRSELPRLCCPAHAAIEHFDEVGDVAPERVSETQQDRETRQHETSFYIADEGDARRALLSNIALCKASGEPQLTQMSSEDLAFSSCL
jgi:hypothetical protein